MSCNADDTSFAGASGTVLSCNIYAYCENDAVNYVDFFWYWTEKYSGFAVTPRGFSVNFNFSFLSKAFSLLYASNVISNYREGRKYTFRYMSAKRIAIELYAHAVLFVIGCGLIEDSVAKAILVGLAIRLSPKNKAKILALNSVPLLIIFIESKLGFYLFDCAKIFNINNDETNKRMLAFNIIWILEGIS